MKSIRLNLSLKATKKLKEREMQRSNASALNLLEVLWDSFAPRLKCCKNASRLIRYYFSTDNAIDFLFPPLHTTLFDYDG